MLLCDRALPAWPAYLYTAHFAAYLAVLDATRFELATLAGEQPSWSPPSPAAAYDPPR